MPVEVVVPMSMSEYPVQGCSTRPMGHGLLQRSIFDVHDRCEEDALYAHLNQLLPAPKDEAESGSSSGADHEDYEAQIERTRRKNKAMLLQLGLGAPKSPPSRESLPQPDEDGYCSLGEDSEGFRTPPPPPSKADKSSTSKGKQKREKKPPRPRQPGVRSLKLFEDGTTISKPLAGTSHSLAYVFLLPRRAREVYTFIPDVPIQPPKPPSPSPPPPAVAPSKAAPTLRNDLPDDRGLAETANKKRPKKQTTAKPRRRTKADLDDDLEYVVDAHGNEVLRSGHNCHQCRRKTTKPVMRCGNCSIGYCYTCMDCRYGAYDPEDGESTFTPDTQDVWAPQLGWTELTDEFCEPQEGVDYILWLCPRCRGICNCAMCLSRVGVKEALELKKPGSSSKLGSFQSSMFRGLKKHRRYPSARHYLESMGIFVARETSEGGSLAAIAYPVDESYISETAEVAHLTAKIALMKVQIWRERQIMAYKRQGLQPPERPQRLKRKASMQNLGYDSEDELEDDAIESESHSNAPTKTIKEQKMEKRTLRRKIVLKISRKADGSASIDGGTSLKVRLPKQRQKRANEQATKKSEADLPVSQVWVKGAADLSTHSSDFEESDDSVAHSSEDSDEDDNDDIDEKPVRLRQAIHHHPHKRRRRRRRSQPKSLATARKSTPLSSSLSSPNTEDEAGLTELQRLYRQSKLSDQRLTASAPSGAPQNALQHYNLAFSVGAGAHQGPGSWQPDLASEYVRPAALPIERRLNPFSGLSDASMHGSAEATSNMPQSAPPMMDTTSAAILASQHYYAGTSSPFRQGDPGGGGFYGGVPLHASSIMGAHDEQPSRGRGLFDDVVAVGHRDEGDDSQHGEPSAAQENHGGIDEDNDASAAAALAFRSFLHDDEGGDELEDGVDGSVKTDDGRRRELQQGSPEAEEAVQADKDGDDADETSDRVED